jgi:integrase
LLGSRNPPRASQKTGSSGRVRIDRAQVQTLLDTYSVALERRPEILALADVAGAPIEADALSWITSHNFRKTTATILDSAGQSARQIADQLGHARPSMTQDVYMGRRTKNPGAAEALEAAIRAPREPKSGG